MLVGRDHELAVVEQLVARARDGASGVLVLRGEAGVGKSALLSHAEQAAVDMHVLRARGLQTEAAIPFAALLELLRPALGHLDRVPRPQAGALEGALALRPARREDRFAVGAATLSLLAAYAETAPLLVVVDDAHWIDGSSAAALVFAVRRLVADRVAVLFAVRSGLPSALDGVDLPTLSLAGLDRAASGALLAGVTGRTVAGGVVDRLHRETGGNPLALVELAAQVDRLDAGDPLETPLPVASRLTGMYLARLHTLGDAARSLLLLAAAGTGELAVLARIGAMESLQLERLAAAEATGLVSIGRDRLDFAHPLIRAAVYGDATPAERRWAHRTLAGVLPDVDLDRRAWHLALAAVGPDADASSALEQAGARARERSAYEVASRAFERAAALALEPRRRAWLRVHAGEASWLAGQPARTLELLDAAAREEPAHTPDLDTQRLRGQALARLGRVAEAHAVLMGAAEEAARSDPGAAVAIFARAMNVAFYAADVAAMQRAVARIEALPGDALTPLERFFAAIARGMTLVFSGEAEGGAALLRESVELIEAAGGGGEDAELLTWAAMAPLWLREAGAGRGLIDRAVETARSRTAIGAMPFLLCHIGIHQAASDRWNEAVSTLNEAIALARETEQRTDLASCLARLAWVEARQGREDDAAGHAAEAVQIADHLGLRLCAVWALQALGENAMVTGRFTEATARFDQQFALLRDAGVGDPDLMPGPELVDVNLRRGRVGAAQQVAELFTQSAERKQVPWSLARAARCRGLLAADGEMAGHFEEALRLHAVTVDAFETARTQLAYGARLRRARRRMRARTVLRVALDTFDRLGARPWSDMAATELAATGETVRPRRDWSARDRLTPQELQIALLLGAGRTTREAAAALFLSPKTIEYHLRSVYGKLGIGSREELARAMRVGEHEAAGAPTGG